MKKTIFAIASLAVLAMGCVKEQQPSSPAESAVVTSLKISVADTKVSVNEATGACTWQEGDQVAVWYEGEDAGQRLVFTYKGLLDDGSAEFITTETVPAGYVATAVAHPVEAINEKTGTLSLIRDWTYDADRRPVYIRSEEVITNEDGSLSAQLVHNASIFKFTLHDIPAYAAGFVLEMVKYAKDEDGNFVDGDGNVIEKETATPSQTIKITTAFPYKTGYTADPKDNSNDITLYSVAAHSSYLTRVYLMDGDKDEIEGSERKFKQSWNDVSKDDFIELPRIDFKKADLRKDFVKVCGIKWAKGNLQSKSTFEEDGFQPRWRIAPTQWHNFKYASASTAEQASPARYDYSNSADEFEHYNFGGIQRNARFYSDGNFLKPAAALEISGKIFSDINGKTEVTGNDRFKAIGATSNADIWGDVAFWASKGKYRMPTNGEMKKFHNVSDKLLGYYITSDGYKVWGVLLRTPNPKRATNTSFIELTDADLESGVFLPNGGRRGNSSSAAVIAVTIQGTYRTGSFISSKKVGDVLKYYSSYYHFADNAVKLYDGTIGTMGDAYDHAAGFLIRPVLVD